MKDKEDKPAEKKYKNFEETYIMCAFSLAIAFMYPNRTNVRKRLIIITLIICFNGGQLFWFLTYTFKCLYRQDLYNFSRNMTMFVIVLLFFIKTYYVIYATNKFALVLNGISRNLLEANNLDEGSQKLYDNYINHGHVGEITWLIIPTFLSAVFPISAGISMSIEMMQTDDYTRLMVHDMELMFFEDVQSQTPFFQCMFAYNCVQCVVLLPNYTGFDGSFCIATTHLCLKLKLMTHKMQKVFENAKTRRELQIMLKEVIRDHQDALEFYKTVQDVYGPWLFAVFMLTSFMISFNLYQMYLLKRIDPKYTLFGLMGVIHIYMPCQYASNLIKVGEEIVSELYSVRWETWADPAVTKLLVFMIARAQKSLVITGGGVIIFNMELFKSIMQTSYSFFTLITNNKD